MLVVVCGLAAGICPSKALDRSITVINEYIFGISLVISVEKLRWWLFHER
jgi:hypothetical protein